MSYQEVQQFIPKLRGLVDARVEAEITRAFRQMYNYFDQQLQQAKNDVVKVIANPNGSSNNNNLFAGPLAAPLVNPGQDLSKVATQGVLTPGDIPNLDASKIVSGIFSLARLDIKILKTDNNLAVDITGAPNVNTGKITIKDNNGNTVNVMVCA